MSDQELDRWTSAWRDGTPPAEGLARMAQRERRLLTAWIALDWVVGAGLLAFAAWIWFAIGTPVMRFAAAGIVLLTIAVLAFTVVNWRGSLAGDRASAADFLGLAHPAQPRAAALHPLRLVGAGRGSRGHCRRLRARDPG